MTAPQGFLGVNVGDIVGQVTKILPPVVGDAIQSTVGKILDPNDPTLHVGDPQPAGTPPIPVQAGSKELGGAVKAIDTVTGAIDVILRLSFLIPDQYEKPLRALEGALKTVRGWLD